MTQNSELVRLPRERVEQLRQMIAGVENATISAAIGKLFAIVRDQGLIEHGIPGIAINTFSDGIAIKFDDADWQRVTFKEAGKISNEIREYLKGNLENTKQVHLCPTHETDFMVWGKAGGRAVAIAIPHKAKPKVLTRDLAEEFADLIDHEIVAAKVG